MVVVLNPSNENTVTREENESTSRWDRSIERSIGWKCISYLHTYLNRRILAGCHVENVSHISLLQLGSILGIRFASKVDIVPLGPGLSRGSHVHQTHKYASFSSVFSVNEEESVINGVHAIHSAAETILIPCVDCWWCRMMMNLKFWSFKKRGRGLNFWGIDPNFWTWFSRRKPSSPFC